ncbi:TPA: hypothetical protein DEP96_01130 [Candidatus Uhrbacteria bacterium]|nr:hypothetical protein [Candidatus Uhrbacteria bacterium]
MAKLSKTRKAIVTAAIVATLGASVFTAVSTTYAATVPSANANPINNLVTTIADKFHLNKDEVQAVFDEQRQQIHADLEAKMSAHLDQAVTNGKLTQAQADAVTAKQAELDTFMKSQKDVAPADRQAAMKTEMDSLKTWAKDNSIPAGFVFRGELGHHGGKFNHHFPGKGPMAPHLEDDDKNDDSE